MSDFNFEPIPGLPGKLPAGEMLLWQGKPDWWSVARRAFHVPVIAGYLSLFAAWRLVSALYGGAPLMETARTVSLMVLLIGACSAILAALAYAVARTTVYSVTSERVVMRYGIALPMALNIPFAKIETAAMRSYGGGLGDIPLRLGEGEKIAYLMLWPHARPWRIARPEPMLRGLPEVAKVAAILGQSLAAAASRPAARAQHPAAIAAPPQHEPAPAPTRHAPTPVQTLRPVPSAQRDPGLQRDMPGGTEPIARLA